MNTEFVQNWFSQVKKGTLSYIILNILDEKEYYGYELVQEIKIHTTLEVAEGTLYPLLTRLKNNGLLTYNWVESTSGPPRKYYILSDEGKNVLEQLDKTWEELLFAVQTAIGERKQ